MKNTLITMLVVVIIGAGILYFAQQSAPSSEEYAGDTETPTAPEATYVNADVDLIVVGAPMPGTAVPRTFTVSGQARGYWFFEASFPLEVVDIDGNSLVVMPVQAEDEWMTEEFVPFSVEVTVPGSYTGAATLILKKDNPSGMPENDASVSIPITLE